MADEQADPSRDPRPTVTHLADIPAQPEPYADYRPIFVTRRLNVTHVHVAPGETVPSHTHLDEDQIYYVVSGSGFVELAGVRTDVAAGSGVLIPLGTEHLITNTGTEPLDYVFFVVFVPEHA
jgi:mannose-6-phosphate isomerase-like protein (cupin superfamily)